MEYDKITMALLATITILLLAVVVATDGADSRGQDDSTPE
jgi:hypothetical protein